MAIKRVLVPLVDYKGVEPLIETAFLAGRLLQAQVRGLMVQRAQLNIPFTGEYVEPDVMRRIVDNARKEREQNRNRARDLFRASAKRFAAVESEFDALEGDIVETVAHAARLADISVLPGGAHYEDGDWYDLRDATLFRSGRPALVIPPNGTEETAFDRVIVAWKESVEAARAVAAAQPFLLTAKEVHVMTVGESTEATASLQDVEQYLQLHYAEVRSEVIPKASGKDVASVLMDRAQGLGGALLVMGAYSRWRWREQIFGGVTESVFRRARTPVLMMR